SRPWSMRSWRSSVPCQRKSARYWRRPFRRVCWRRRNARNRTTTKGGNNGTESRWCALGRARPPRRHVRRDRRFAHTPNHRWRCRRCLRCDAGHADLVNQVPHDREPQRTGAAQGDDQPAAPRNARREDMIRWLLSLWRFIVAETTFPDILDLAQKAKDKYDA